jgi:hypothetical protein
MATAIAGVTKYIQLHFLSFLESFMVDSLFFVGYKNHSIKQRDARKARMIPIDFGHLAISMYHIGS